MSDLYWVHLTDRTVKRSCMDLKPVHIKDCVLVQSNSCSEAFDIALKMYYTNSRGELMGRKS
jgi:hypothetical protein